MLTQRLTMRAPHLQVLEADLEVQLPGAGDDVLAGLLDGYLDHGVRLGQPLQPLHQLRQVLRMLQLPATRTMSVCICAPRMNTQESPASPRGGLK